MRILISLPIYKRDWILPKWLECIENQTIPLTNIGFQFELGPDDDDTHEILWEWQSQHPECFLFDAQINAAEKHSHHLEGQRAWKREEYLKMVTFRNNLLERAAQRLDSFDRYFSLDSDVLLADPQTLEKLSGFDVDVISPLMYMTFKNNEDYDTRFPNSMNWHSTGTKFLARRNTVTSGLQKLDVPMAAVMMKPDVVDKIRYRWHPQGEDIGFATELFDNQISSYIDYDVYTPHIMHRAQLADYIKNGDPRG